MFNWFKKLFSDIHVAYLDVVNKKKFIKDFEAEKSDPKSLVVRLGVALDPKTKTKLSIITVLDQVFAQYEDERLIRNQLNETAKLFNEFLVYPFSWAEYFWAPEYYKIDDEDTPMGQTSVTYLITWKWAPKMINNKNFWFRVAGFTLGSLTALAGIITGIILL